MIKVVLLLLYSWLEYRQSAESAYRVRWHRLESGDEAAECAREDLVCHPGDDKGAKCTTITGEPERKAYF